MKWYRAWDDGTWLCTYAADQRDAEKKLDALRRSGHHKTATEVTDPELLAKLEATRRIRS